MKTPAIRVRSVPAGRGLSWWSTAYRWLFGAPTDPFLWIAISLCAALLPGLIGTLLGVAGSIAAQLLWLLFYAGLMGAAQRTGSGQAVRFRDLFGGFGPGAGALLGLGLLLLLFGVVLGALLLGLILVAVAGTAGALLGGPHDWAALPSLSADRLLALSPPNLDAGSALLLLLCLVLLVVLCAALSMAAWLAPALVVLRGAHPLAALRLSLAAGWRNAGALTVYGIALVFLALAATIPLMLGWLVLLPLMTLSTYAAYGELFEAAVEVIDAEAESAAAPSTAPR